MIIFRTLLALLFIGLCTLSAGAEEKIERFDIDIAVQTNGDFVITERIIVNAEGRRIKRGIFRDIPRFLMDGKYKIPQRIDVFSVNRDGEKSPFSESNNGDALEVRIGEASVFLDPGAYAYEIKYRVENQVRYFEDHDEVYWNATGTYWVFPIDKAIARIILPQGARVQSHDAYTGPQNSTAQNYTYFKQGGAHIFETTQPLDIREGLTVSLSFDKGLIDTPTRQERGRIFWLKYAALILLSVLFIPIGLYYYLAWRKVGRDPDKTPLFPRYEPPLEYSPGALSYIHYGRMTGNKALIATLVRLSIDGYLDMHVKGKTTVLKNTKPAIMSPPLYDDERIVHAKLFRKSDTMTLDGSENSKFDTARIRFESHLKKRYPRSKFFRYNPGYMFWGFLASAFALILSICFIRGYVDPGFWLLALGLLGLNILFFILLPAPTRLGQDLEAEIDGLMLYMNYAEKLQMNAYEVGGPPPPMTLERYEKFLPYAIALGLERPWSAHFEAAIPEIAKTYQSTWIQHDGRINDSLSSVTRSIVSNLDSSVTASRPKPVYTTSSSSSSGSSSWSSSSSSSSSSGGGYSGGGGGGGGGGGW